MKKDQRAELDFQTIFAELNNQGIDYVVVGGLAVNLHGIPRMTYDIDLMVLLEEQNILRIVNKLTGWGYRPKVPVDPRDLADDQKRDFWMREKGMKALNFYSESQPIGEIAIVIDASAPYRDLKTRAVYMEIGGERIPVISIHDLIEMKMRAGRKQDLSDVEHLRIILEK